MQTIFSRAQKVRTALADLGQRRLVREGVWIVIGHAVTVLAGVVSIRLFTELAPQAVFGSANLLLGMLTLGMNSFIAPITQTQIRYHVTHRDRGEGDCYTWIMAQFAAKSAVVTSGITCALLLIWPAARLGAGTLVIALLVAWIATSTYRAIMINVVQADRRQKRYAAWVATEAILQILFTWAFLSWWPQSEGYIAGQVTGTLVAALTFGVRPKRISLSKIDAQLDLRAKAWRQVSTYGLPFAALALLGWLSNLSDRYVLAANLDTAAVGRYVAAFGIASRVPALLGGLLTDLFRPALFEAENRSNGARADGIFRTWILTAGCGTSLMVAALFLFGDHVAQVLLAESYRAGAKNIMCWVAVGYVFVVLAQIVENRLLSIGVSRALILTKVFGGVANLVFALLLIPMMGVIGAARANAAGQFIMLLACAVLSLKFSRGAGRSTP